MASRAEAVPGALPGSPRLRGAIRAALSDFYFNSLRMVGANLVWSAVLGLIYLVSLAWPFGVLVLLPVLALPTAGIYRLACQIVRGEMSTFADALLGWSRFGARALALGAIVVLGAAVFGFNLAAGLDLGGFVGWTLATLSFWGLAVGATVVLVAWPLVVDPRREDQRLAAGLRLAGLLVLAFPLRFGAMTLIVVVFLIASTIAFAALAMLSVSLAALVTARYVLPAADRFEAQMAARARVA